MKNDLQRRPTTPARQPYRTLRGWALGVLIDEGAIQECDHHGHRRDRRDPDAWNRAREIARHAPFPRTTADQSVEALDDVLGTIGDSCPDCS